jgi:hypothetical protein
MCELNKKSGNKRIDPCIRNFIKRLNLVFDKMSGNKRFRTVASCCGHGKYPMTIVCEYYDRKSGYQTFIEFISGKEILRNKRFYKRDKQGYYYIPEIIEEKKK